MPLALLVAAFSVVLSVGTASAVAPTIVSTGVSAVTSSTAVLEAEINPEGEATTYHFEYGLTDCSSNPCASAPMPDANAGSGASAAPVQWEIGGLSPDTTYHFRVVANNGSGPSAGPDRTFTTYAASQPDTNCPNQAFRVGPGANLPDCRAYEMVSPVDKGGRGILAATTQPAGGIRAAFDKAAGDGDGITYTSATAFGDAVSNVNANQYLSRRGAAGWTTHAISAFRPGSVLFGGTAVTAWGFDTQFQLFSEDLSEAWIRDPSDPPLLPDAVAGFGNFYRRDNTNDTYHEPFLTAEPLFWNQGDLEAGIVLGGPGNIEGMKFKGRSADGSHVLFEAEAQLLPEATETLKSQIYDSTEGGLRLVSVLPGGEANPENSWVGGHLARSLESSGEARGVAERAISEDGSRIFWVGEIPSIGSSAGRIYVRIDGTETVPISESVTPEPSRFVTADTDGSTALFSFDPDGFGGPAQLDLYEFDVDTETPTLIAHEVTAVPGASEDLSRFYFVSRDVLDVGATADEENLYLDQGGTIRFITTLASVDVFGAGESFIPTVSGRATSSAGVDPRQLATRVTPDGSHLAFMSRRSLTGYDNTDAVNGEADAEVFLYDAGADELTCVSCNPSGARPHGGGTRVPAYHLGKPEVPAAAWRTAAWIPPSEQEQNTSRVLSDDGNRIFFNAIDSLAPQDTNGRQDVYQWEAQGTGGCQKAGGCIDLITTGKSGTYSEFIDASADGRDVFIRTESSIDARDTGLMDIYDARIGGGFPPPPPPPPPCSGEACQIAPPPQNDPTPASAAFRGQGNVSEGRDCRPAARRANGLSRQAKRLRRRSKAMARQGNQRAAKHARLKAGRLAKSAKRLSKNAKRCRRAKREAGR